MFSAHFVRSGWVGLPYTAGTFGGAGYESFWWSSRTYPSTDYAYHLYVAANTYPSGNTYFSYRYGGFPLRCLSTVLDM